jgi:hypothetical protein
MAMSHLLPWVAAAVVARAAATTKHVIWQTEIINEKGVATTTVNCHPFYISPTHLACNAVIFRQFTARQQ